MSAYEALSRHPWATPLLLSPLPIRLRRLYYLEALLARLNGAGLSQAQVFHAYHVLDAYIFVEDADALYAEYAARGVKFTRELANMPWRSREFVVKDCDGRLLAFGANL